MSKAKPESMEDAAKFNDLRGAIISSIQKNLNAPKFRFFLIKHSPFPKSSHVEIDSFNITGLWENEYTISKFARPRRIYTDAFNGTLVISGTLNYRSRGTGITNEVRFEDRLEIEALIGPSNGAFEYEVYDSQKRAIKTYFDTSEHEAENFGIQSLSDSDNRYSGTNAVNFFTTITRNQRATKLSIANDFEIYHDMLFCSADIKNAMGQLLNLKKYCSTYLDYSAEIGGKKFYQYFPNTFDKQFFSQCGITIQLFYNFWDKIGDLLNACFASIPKAKKVYFTEVIDRFPVQYHQSPNLQFLRDFRANEYKILNGKRIEVVHYTNLESTFFKRFQAENTEQRKMEELQKERDGLLNFFKNQNEIMIAGFEKTVLLIDEIQ